MSTTVPAATAFRRSRLCRPSPTLILPFGPDILPSQEHVRGVDDPYKPVPRLQDRLSAMSSPFVFLHPHVFHFFPAFLRSVSDHVADFESCFVSSECLMNQRRRNASHGLTPPDEMCTDGLAPGRSGRVLILCRHGSVDCSVSTSIDLKHCQMSLRTEN